MNKLLEIKFGSHLYGTDTPESDLDFKSVYIPEARDIILQTYKKVDQITRKKQAFERNKKDDVDIEIFSLDRFLDDLMVGQTWALDILFAPESSYVYSTEEGRAIMRLIRENRDKLITRNVNAFVGYARQQAAKYGIKGSRMDSLKRTMECLEQFKNLHDKLVVYRPWLEKLVEDTKTLISLEKTPLVEIVMLKGPKGLIDQPHLRVNGRNIPFHATVKYAKEIVNKMLTGYGERAKKAHLAGGVDWKALSHAVRVNHEAMELLQTGQISFPRPERELLLKIKLGQMEHKAVYSLIEEGLAKLYEMHAKSPLRDEPDYDWANNLVYDLYSKVVKNS